MPCIVCKHPESEPHHQAPKGHGGKGVKTDDSNCLPLCYSCHSRLHQIGKDSFALQNDLDYDYVVERLNEIWKKK